IGWYSADVSSLVAGWLNGSVANLGVLLDQAEIAVPRTRYRSREYAAFEPYLEVCYSDVSGEVCEKVISMADAYIYELHPDENRGTNTSLYTGWNDETDLEKQVLVRFDLPVVEPKAELGDYVWEDLNSDGIQDADEPGIPRVIVNLYDCAGQELATMVTDGNGGYLFTGLDAGQYFVEFVLPGGFAFTIPDAGNDDAADSDADPVNGTTSCVALRTGESNRTIDAGLVVSEQTGCTRTIGYWKTHAGTKRHGVDAVTPLLPIWLGTENGDKSVEITTAREAVAVLGQKTLGRPWNGITKLYAQLLAAKLNMAAGASGDAVSGVVADADSFLAEHSWKSWNGLSWTEKKTVLEWKTTLDMYNNGKIGPGHCGCDGGGPRHK
ncbi:MAG: hypothetical protein KKA42_16300, partial [candidate division Zixibacteria bacterium]|nr:hypothetical protein [candidate division Zixibacteria bacterium]